MVEILSEGAFRRDCDLYVRGHRIHSIQALRAGNGGKLRTNGLVVRVDGEVIVFQTDDDVLKLRNHHPAAVEHLVREYGPVAELVAYYGVLQFGGGRLVCVAGDDGQPLGPCVQRPAGAPVAGTPRELAEELMTYGGFMAPVPRSDE